MADTDILISVLSQFRDVVPHSGLCEFHISARCREVSLHGLIAKNPSLHLRYYLGHYPRFGKNDRNNDRFKNRQLCGADSRFVTTER